MVDLRNSATVVGEGMGAARMAHSGSLRPTNLNVLATVTRLYGVIRGEARV